MNFVANIVETKFSEVLMFKDELECCEEASKINSQALQADMNELRNGIKFVENELQNHKDAPVREIIDNLFLIYIYIFCPSS